MAGRFHLLLAIADDALGLIGKPAGILLFSTGARIFGARLPSGLMLRHLVVVGVVASIGFTVSLFFATGAFPDGTALAETGCASEFLRRAARADCIPITATSHQPLTIY